MSLVATCPSCGTVFSMVREQLEASGGQVRCGHCMVVFDANAPVSLSAAAEEKVSQLELAQTELPHADLSFVQQAQKHAFWSRKSVIATLSVTALMLCLLLTLQIFRLQSERVVQATPSMKPLVGAVCSLWTCPTPKQLQIDGWRIESSNFQKEGEGAFRLTVQLKNTLATRLLVPQLELSLLDMTDALLVRRTMPIAGASESIPSGEDRTYHFLVSPQADLYNTITGYRLVLFYP
jgi:predicted Zn finger-like uncharacterized protein